MPDIPINQPLPVWKYSTYRLRIVAGKATFWDLCLRVFAQRSDFVKLLKPTVPNFSVIF